MRRCPVRTHGSPGPTDPPPADVVARLRAAGCVFAEEEAALLSAQATGAELAALVDRRAAGEPLEAVLGWVGFCGLRLEIGPGVFVPRRRTELLARTAVRLAAAAAPGPAVVVDACCGVAPVATLVAHELPGAVVHAADVDPVAVGWAARNLAGRGRAWQGDLLDPLPASLRGAVDVLVANAPYVPRAAIATMPPEARLHEPHVALDGGPDGVALQRRLLAQAPAWVRPGGAVAVETSRRQVPLTRAACPPGWHVEVLHDEDVDGTVVVAHHPA